MDKSIIAKELFEQAQEELKHRSNVERIDGKTKRKDTHYSAKDIERQNE